jgi:hypothetical protein
MSEMKKDSNPSIGKVMKQETVVKKAVKPKLVIGMGAAATADPAECQAFRLASSPFPRKDHGSVSKVKSRNQSPDRNAMVGNMKPKVEVVQAPKWSDNVQSSLDRTRKSGKSENVDIGVNAAQAVGKSQHQVHGKGCGEAAQTKLNSPQEFGKAGQGPIASGSMKTTTGSEVFAKVLVRLT